MVSMRRFCPRPDFVLVSTSRETWHTEKSPLAYLLVSCTLHRNEYAFPEDEEDQDSEEDDDDASHSERPADWDQDEVSSFPYLAAGHRCRACLIFTRPSCLSGRSRTQQW
jgi:hypothetical protein